MSCSSATVQNSTSGSMEAVHPAIILGNPRDDDPTTLRLREDPLIELDDIVSNLHQYRHTSTSAASSSVPTDSVFSSRKESLGTKPTSAGTSYPLHKGKAVATYSSSLSATHGSDSEHERAREDPFAGMGDWAGVKQPRAPNKKPSGQSRPKKPVVIIQDDRKAYEDDQHPSTHAVSRRNGKSKSNQLALTLMSAI